MFDEFFALEKQIHAAFGYKENWKLIPLADHRDYYWALDNEGRGGEVRYAETVEKLADEDAGQYYSAMIYTQRFLTKWVYRTETHTMICMDTQCDDNKYLGIFDNSKMVSQ